MISADPEGPILASMSLDTLSGCTLWLYPHGCLQLLRFLMTPNLFTPSIVIIYYHRRNAYSLGRDQKINTKILRSLKFHYLQIITVNFQAYRFYIPFRIPLSLYKTFILIRIYVYPQT